MSSQAVAQATTATSDDAQPPSLPLCLCTHWIEDELSSPSSSCARRAESRYLSQAAVRRGELPFKGPTATHKKKIRVAVSIRSIGLL